MAPTVLYVDCPWKLNDKLPWGGAEHHYACLTLDELKAFTLPAIVLDATDVVLFAWRLASEPTWVYEVARAWGFVPKSEVVWCKTTSRGNPHFGMGRYVRNSHEICVIATHGSAQPSVRNVRSRFEAKVRAHSQKPDEMYEIIERMYPDSLKVELFSRARRVGWASFGDELG